VREHRHVRRFGERDGGAARAEQRLEHDRTAAAVVVEYRRPAREQRVHRSGTALGIAFLVGQVLAWAQLERRGFYVSGHPSTAFFYVLTWAHAAHVVGALIAVMYVEFRALRYELGPGRRTMVDVSAIFWHFLDVLWLGIMAIFAFWA
jgi:cytochrome c oxidase subunit 3